MNTQSRTPTFRQVRSCLTVTIFSLFALLALAIWLIPATEDSGISGSVVALPTVTPSAPAVATPVTTGDLWWRIYMVTERGQTLKSASSSNSTAGRYVEIHADLRNDGARALDMPRIVLVDSRGREYEPDASLSWYIEDGRDCFWDDLPPGVPRLCSFIYEIAADATGLRAVWQGDAITLVHATGAQRP